MPYIYPLNSRRGGGSQVTVFCFTPLLYPPYQKCVKQNIVDYSHFSNCGNNSKYISTLVVQSNCCSQKVASHLKASSNSLTILRSCFFSSLTFLWSWQSSVLEVTMTEETSVGTRPGQAVPGPVLPRGSIAQVRQVHRVSGGETGLWRKTECRGRLPGD